MAAVWGTAQCSACCWQEANTEQTSDVCDFINKCCPAQRPLPRGIIYL